MKKISGLLLALLVSTGCLDMQVEHTLYVERDGGLTWTIFEREVYSLEDSAEDREREERGYLDDALAGNTAMAEALRELGATSVETEVLRERRPFDVRVSASFVDPAAAISGLLSASDVDAQVRLVAAGERARRLVIALEAIEEDGLRDALGDDTLRFVMTSGRFVAARGFRLEDDGRVAVWEAPSGDDPATAPIRYELTWQFDVEG